MSNYEPGALTALVNDDLHHWVKAQWQINGVHHCCICDEYAVQVIYVGGSEKMYCEHHGKEAWNDDTQWHELIKLVTEANGNS